MSAILSGVTSALGGLGKLSGLLFRGGSALGSGARSTLGLLGKTGRLIAPTVAIAGTSAAINHYAAKKEREEQEAWGQRMNEQQGYG